MRRTFILLKIESLQMTTYGGLSALYEANKKYLQCSLSKLQKHDFEHDYKSKDKRYIIHADFAKTTSDVRKELNLSKLLLNILA